MKWFDLISNIQQSSYLQLPTDFFEMINPIPIANPYLVKFNHELAAYLCAPNISSYPKEAIAFYAGNLVPKHLKSIALAYAGHQFGYYVPLLGDGRAVVLGELQSKDNKRWDMQLKGSGKTMFSRMGDGRAPLSAVIREYLISEAMVGLKIPTTRCLAAIASTQKIDRQSGPVPLGVLTRIASSSIRVGSFEYAANQNTHLLKCLTDYTIARHYPELVQQKKSYLQLFTSVLERQASLIAEWMSVGFIHGVMNTDNMAISGETIDYGPCAFMDEFNFGTVFSSIDYMGRYAYGNQPAIAQWNLTVFRQTLLPLLNQNEESSQQLQEILDSFPGRFQYYWHKKVREKLGLFNEKEQDAELIKNFFSLLQEYKPDFTNTFRLLSKTIDSVEQQNLLLEQLGNQTKSKRWFSAWLSRIKQQDIDLMQIKTQMEQINPAYIPRNHLVENAINHFIEKNDSTLIDDLLKVMKNPYLQYKNTKHLQALPTANERIYQTFCGT